MTLLPFKFAQELFCNIDEIRHISLDENNDNPEDTTHEQ